jgi:DNA-binding NarL/FixJ family response regulator
MPTGTSPYQIILADDHAILRHGLRRILQEKPGLEVVGEVADGIELLNLLTLCKLQPHLVILDISMPNLSGIEATRQIKAIRPETKILILSMHREKEYFSKAMSAGAEGYLLKEEADSELFSAINLIRQGGVYVSTLITGKLEEGSL